MLKCWNKSCGHIASKTASYYIDRRRRRWKKQVLASSNSGYVWIMSNNVLNNVLKVRPRKTFHERENVLTAPYIIYILKILKKTVGEVLRIFVYWITSDIPHMFTIKVQVIRNTAHRPSTQASYTIGSGTTMQENQPAARIAAKHNIFSRMAPYMSWIFLVLVGKWCWWMPVLVDAELISPLDNAM